MLRRPALVPLLVSLAPTVALADEAAPVGRLDAELASAPRPAPPSLALRQGAVSASLTFEMEATAGHVAEPLSIAPDVSYGVTDRLTASIVHSRAALTGFRAAVGGGFCVTGEDARCGQLYNNVGAELLYSVRPGATPLALVGGVHALDLANDFYGAKVGLRVRHTRGKLALHATPSVIVAVTERSDAMGVRQNHDTFWVPLQVTYKALPPLTVGLASGLKGRIDGFANAWELPVGASAQYAVDPRVAIGASLVFGKLAGGADPMPGGPAVTGADFRGANAWVTFTTL